MGLLSKFEGKMEDAVEGTAASLGGGGLSPVQITKKAEKQMRREKMVGAGKQYAPTLYTVLVSNVDDSRMFSYYPTLAGEIETYLLAKAAELGFMMDGQPLVRFIADPELKKGKFDVVAELVASPIVARLRQEEMQRYGIGTPMSQQPAPAPQTPARNPMRQANRLQPLRQENEYDEYDELGDQDTVDVQDPDGSAPTVDIPESDLDAYLYDESRDKAYALNGNRQRIGRESGNEIIVPDINVSRVHAEIRMEPNGSWIISDLGSTNGVYVNGRQVKSAPLRDADMILVGTTELEFQLLS